MNATGIGFMLGLLLTMGIRTGAAETDGEVFERYQVILPAATHVSVLTGFFSNAERADLAVVSSGGDVDTIVQIFPVTDIPPQAIDEFKLGSGVQFVDVANVGGSDHLVSYQSGTLTLRDPMGTTENQEIPVNIVLPQLPFAGILHMDISHDVNDNGRDDLVIPVKDGWQVFVQLPDGRFANPAMLAGTDRHNTVTGYRWNPWPGGGLFKVDYNHDGRGDLVVWAEGHFAAHLQGGDGLFTNAPVTFTTQVEIDSADIGWLVAPNGVRARGLGEDPAGAMIGRVLYSMQDMNGDGIADLSIFSLGGGSLWKMDFSFAVHFGHRTAEGGTGFAQVADTVINSDGIPFSLAEHDFDKNGQVDMLFTRIKPGLFRAIGMLAGSVLTNSVSLKMEVYAMEDGAYSPRPVTYRKIKAYLPAGNTAQKDVAFPTLLTGDVNGDGLSDLLVQKGRRGLFMYPGVDGQDPLTRKHHSAPIGMSAHEESLGQTFTWLTDLDRNGSQDIIVHDLDGAGKHRVTVLVAR